MIKFQRSLRGGFQSRLSSRAAATIKGERTKKMKGLKYTTACVMCLLSVFIQIVFIYELAPFPTSFSENSGDPKFVK